MNLTTNSYKNCYCIYLDGELDASSSLEFDNAIKSAIDDESAKNIIVDCTNLNYVSSAGLGVIMSYLTYFKENNIGFIICCLKDNVLETFKILGLEKLVTIVPNLNEAFKTINEV